MRARVGVMMVASACASGCAAVTDAVVDPQITMSEPRPVAAAEDIFNVAMVSALAPGMIVTVRISPGEIELQHVQMMLVPGNPRRAGQQGNEIIVVALDNGSRVSQVAATDPTIVFDAEQSETRIVDRIVSVAIPTPTRIDTLEVTVTATGESKRFDVLSVLEEYCAQAVRSPPCRAD